MPPSRVPCHVIPVAVPRPLVFPSHHSLTSSVCVQLFARDLDDVIHSSEFMDLVVESAASIEARQETDSIPLLDDIRHHIHRLHVVGHWQIWISK